MAIFPSVFLFLLAVGLGLLTILTRRKIKESYIDFRAIAYSYDLMSSSFRPGQNTYHFSILGNPVVGLKGQQARKVFFNERSFSTSEGYKVFSKAAPVPELAKTLLSAEEGHGLHFKKQLEILVNKNRLADSKQQIATYSRHIFEYTTVIATMLGDMQRITATWNNKGSMDPFDKINDITFHVTAHMITSNDFVSDSVKFSQFQTHFFTQLKNNTPAMIFLPWFYRKSQREKEIAITSLFTTLTSYIEVREKYKISTSEPIDLLLDHGMNSQEIIQFILGFLFGGVYNATKAISWILIYISMHSQWKMAIRSEVEDLLSKHSFDISKPLHSRLSEVPLEAWEESLPTLDLVISETFRLVMNQTVLRRNIGEDVEIPGGQGHVPSGAFVAYSNADAHLEPEIYDDPWSFKPDRFEHGKQKVLSNDFLGWGAGRHRCVGLGIAKLTIKTIVCLFVMTYDYDITRTKRKSNPTIPTPDHNKVNQVSVLEKCTAYRFIKILIRRHAQRVK
ncbi:cytochrome P450 [Lentinula aff. lateritia]|uniref:Cytochrome P450 n=1 Tax=Lentinula aff. lateritia TaxID=2804960 RepID=A0ACC1U5E7_9AGAR|nr:cytochrome P450 [Lentinula aff. lateritia]